MMVHVIFVCKRDAGFIPSFVAAWGRVWGVDCELVFANDAIDPVPVEKLQGRRSVMCPWPRVGAVADGVVPALKEVAAMTGAKWIFKGDVDVVHIGRSWFDSRSGDARMVGWDNEQRGGLYGGCYALQSEVLDELHEGMEWESRFEDVAMTKMVKALGHEVDGVSTDPKELSPFRGAVSLGWDLDAITTHCEAVHTGEGGKCARGRERSRLWQQAVVDHVAAEYGLPHSSDL